MSLLKHDDEQERPSEAETRSVLRSLSVTPWPLSGPGIDRLLSELEPLYGEPLFARFRFADNPVLRWYSSRGHWLEISFFEHLLRTEAVRTTLPDLEIDGAELDLQLSRGSAFTLDGELAEALVYGGPYFAFPGSAREAKALAGEACEDLFGGRHNEVTVYRSDAAWSPWFCGLSWDHTWIGLDRRTSAVWLLCLRATD